MNRFEPKDSKEFADLLNKMVNTCDFMARIYSENYKTSRVCDDHYRLGLNFSIQERLMSARRIADELVKWEKHRDNPPLQEG